MSRANNQGILVSGMPYFFGTNNNPPETTKSTVQRYLEGEKSMHIMIKASLFVLTSGLAFNAAAASHVSEVWTCKLNEGKKIEEECKKVE